MFFSFSKLNCSSSSAFAYLKKSDECAQNFSGDESDDTEPRTSLLRRHDPGFNCHRERTGFELELSRFLRRSSPNLLYTESVSVVG
jgi:hypothetical protein